MNFFKRSAAATLSLLFAATGASATKAQTPQQDPDPLAGFDIEVNLLTNTCKGIPVRRQMAAEVNAVFVPVYNRQYDVTLIPGEVSFKGPIFKELGDQTLYVIPGDGIYSDGHPEKFQEPLNTTIMGTAFNFWQVCLMLKNQTQNQPRTPRSRPSFPAYRQGPPPFGQ